MSQNVLVAGIGNVFFSDDGFGVEVARRLSREPLPESVRVVDFGIRGLHLAFDLLSPPRLLLLIDAAKRGGQPGTLYVIAPEEGLGECGVAERADPHGMNLGEVFAAVRNMGGHWPRTLIIGCEPQELSEGMALSEPVRQAITPAVDMIRRLIERGNEHAQA